MSGTNAQTIRQLTIKTGSLKRLFKEETTYKQEVVDQQKVLTKLKEDGADGADIRAAERVLRDSEMMVPRTQKSIEDAYEALSELVTALKSDTSIAESTEYTKAQALLEEVDAARTRAA